MGESAKDINLEVSNHFIAYFDILGYRQLVNALGENEFLNIINGVIEDAYNRVKGINEIEELMKSGHEISINVFSDNVILSIPSSEAVSEMQSRFRAILTFMAEIQLVLLLKYKVAIRGAIVHGSFFCGKRLVYGKALISAVDIENEQAIYPRIIVSNECVNLFENESSGKWIDSWIASRLTTLRRIDDLGDDMNREVLKQLTQFYEACYNLKKIIRTCIVTVKHIRVDT